MEPAEAQHMLEEADFGFLGLAGKDGQPYVVPVNHTVVDGCIVFHAAKEGQKLDLIRENPLVSYAVCTEHEVLPEKLSTKYRSAIAFGKAEIVDEPKEKKRLLVALVARLAPGVPFSCGDDSFDAAHVIRIKVDRVTGKKRD
jgi:nitroimidazol reductase NimA-like FMN-containing flavoprotein (pyridoxamine 5'-phosphate oxidase superfamily)